MHIFIHNTSVDYVKHKVEVVKILKLIGNIEVCECYIYI